MDSYEIIENYSIFSSEKAFVTFKREVHSDSIAFKVQWSPNIHPQYMKVYLEPGKCISIHKVQGIKTIEAVVMQYFVKGMKIIIEKELQDHTVLWEQLKLSSILNFFLKQTTSHLYIEKYIDIIRFLEKVSVETYEGKRICMAIGFDDSLAENDNDKDLLDIGNNILKVLTNGIHTLFVCNSQTKFVNIECLENPVREKDAFLYPLIFSKIAHWTSFKKRFACVLTLQGEILFFNKNQLLFTKRGGEWKFLSPTALLQKMKSQDALEAVRNAVMATCLDVSFSRTGACIGILSDPNDKADFILSEDRLENKSTLQKIVSGKKFQELDREIRKELAALDGAIVMDGDGTIRAIGAILKNDECINRDGQGARSIAAQVLALHGYGFKVSSDGEITLWGKSAVWDGLQPIAEPLFRLL